MQGIWLTRGKEGRLTVYASVEGGLRRWTETRPGTLAWGQPVLVAVPGLSHLSVTQDDNAYVHFVGRRERRNADRRTAVDVVYAIQYQSGRPVAEWRALGNPHKDMEEAARLGRPAVVVTASGMVHIFVGNADGGLALRREQSDGKWRGWEHRKGVTGVEGDLAAIALSSGRIELFATTAEGILHWSQKEAGGGLGDGYPSRLAVSRDSLAVAETGPDRPTFYWTDAGGRGVVAYRAGGWPMALGGAPGDGPHAVTRTFLDGYDCTVLAHRGVEGTAVVGVGVTEDEGNGVWWSDTGVRCLATPALAEDAFGRLVVAVVDEHGAPKVARQTDEPGLTLSEWRAL
ncbi:hypothetical protein [Streptomyces sp. NRRL S-15]|uniref:hypothetical protein n=1 Tax=Streptomyces sp. NRRL S-15 TaxID=1463886 RepID=UPI0004C70A8E|nr:hypothetical protein [Streptomyces sp. NRRL S-15]